MTNHPEALAGSNPEGLERSNDFIFVLKRLILQ